MGAPRVDFYVLDPAGGESGRLPLVCRLVDKAYAAGQPTLVLGDDRRELVQLDELLWTALDGSFIPHELLQEGTDGAGAEAPILLATHLPGAAPRALLINLCATVPPVAAEFQRVIEVPATDPAGREQGRERFRAWRRLGAEPATHQLGGQTRPARPV
ncbi:MAG: DNA polymerase III subunit chi [Steroidobacteraceae bacterium]